MERTDWKSFPTTTITASSWDELDEAENVSDKNLNKINMAESFSHNDEMKSIKGTPEFVQRPAGEEL